MDHSRPHPLPSFGGCPTGTQFILLEPHQLPTDEQLADVHLRLDILVASKGRLRALREKWSRHACELRAEGGVRHG